MRFSPFPLRVLYMLLYIYIYGINIHTRCGMSLHPLAAVGEFNANQNTKNRVYMWVIIHFAVYITV